MSYARAKYAYGFCDKTGFRYKLKDLVPEFNNGVKTGFLVGKDVVDPDQPQNFLGRVKIFDPQSLRDPRPDPRVEPATAAALDYNPFSVNGTTLVVTEANHGRSGTVRFYGAEAFAGISASLFNRDSGYTIISSTTNTYTVTLSQSATSVETGGGVNVYAGPVTETP